MKGIFCLAFTLCIFAVFGLSSGQNEIRIETLKEGDKETYPKKGQTAVVHYTGTLVSNGEKFDSSVDRGQPFSVKVGKSQVIKCWTLALQRISLGETAKVFCPAKLAYGLGGAPPLIGPNADLYFEIQMLQIQNL